MRCAQCTQGICENYSRENKNCQLCSAVINLCPKCRNSKIQFCDKHAKREHICLSKCLHECILLTNGPKTKKRKLVKKKEINILHQVPITF